jgi:hypothetical protein
MTLTTEAVLALAPDGASAKSARELVLPSKWPLLGANEAAAWGECQGSGPKPYQTQVDLSGPAFRCSCPSRKFPCKHGLALMLLRAQNAAAFTATAAPAWVGEWLASRADKAQKKEEKQTARAAEPADPQAAAKRDGQRWQRIEAAAQELQRWLADQIARGLGALGHETLQSWHTMARRMVDAQAPGLGQRLREAAEAVHRDTDWPERTLERLGLLQLACDALARRAQLPPDVQADLRFLAGWPQDRAEVLAAGERVSDRWCVLGSATEEREAKLTERRVWLQGQHSGRRAWLLDHAFGGRGFEHAWRVGTSVDATMVFVPGASALRVLPADALGPPQPVVQWPAASGDAEWLAVARRVAACPWVGLHPLVLRDAVPLRHLDRTELVSDGRVLTLALGDTDVWTLLAAAGGRPLQMMGEWDGHRFAPLSAWSDAAGPAVWMRGSA